MKSIEASSCVGMVKSDELLSVRELSVEFATDSRQVEVVDRLGLSIHRGRTLALVGESGCGKSVTASSIMRLLPQPYGIITSGSIIMEGQDLLKLPVEEMRSVRGGKISMIFQEPMNAMNPVQQTGKQIMEVLALHRPALSLGERREECLRLLRQVEMPSPERRLKNYPFQLSGGMRQRVMIAMALAGNPSVLLADEPTTALDVTVQSQILELIASLQRESGMGVLFITHDMGVVAEISDDVVVMYAGQVIESGSTSEIFASPLHPYTRGLISSMPDLDSVPKSKLPAIRGVVPAPSDYPKTCRFAPRCDYAADICRNAEPVLKEHREKHHARCHRIGEI